MPRTIIEALAGKNNDYFLFEDKYASLTNGELLDPNPNSLATLPPLKSLTASIIIPAWNASETILACLSAIEQSSFNLFQQDKLEVIIVDDGSTDNTWELVRHANLSLNIKVVKQPHLGYSHARNTGASVAGNNIIIFCDSDVVLLYNAIEHLILRHQMSPNIVLVGFRANIDKKDNYADSLFIRKYGSPRGTCFSKDHRIEFFVPGWPSNICLTTNHFKEFGFARDLWMPDKDAWTLPDMVFGALFSMPRDTYMRIGGSDERFRGWGCEDGYLAANAIALGHYIIPVYAASGLHIDHPPRTKNRESEYARNRRQYLNFLKTNTAGESTNWLPIAKKRITKIYTRPSEKNIRKPTRNKSYFLKVDDLLATGKYRQALEQLDVEKEKSDERSDTLLKRGKALLGLSQYAEAIEILGQSISSATREEAFIALLFAQAADGQFNAARKTLKKLFDQHPPARKLSYWHDWTAREHIEQGIKNKKQGFKAVALRCFEIALAKDPNNKEAQEYRAGYLESLR